MFIGHKEIIHYASNFDESTTTLKDEVINVLPPLLPRLFEIFINSIQEGNRPCYVKSTSSSFLGMLELPLRLEDMC